MSANNWATCPKCKKQYGERVQKILAELGDQYGKVTADKYRELSIESDKKLSQLREPVDGWTLREDWELGTYIDGTFMVSYSCSCDVCGLSYSHKFSEFILRANQVKS